jgi:hypothetical protein
MRHLILASLIAVAALLIPSSASAQMRAHCYPDAYGALPDDGLDDTAGLQAALDTGCLELREGAYEIRRVAAKKASLVITKAGTRVWGQGARRSWLRMVGPGSMGDWRGIHIACRQIPQVPPVPGRLVCDPSAYPRDVELRDFGFDNSLMYDTEEQTHAVQVGPGASGIEIERMSFWHPIRYKPLGGVEGGGDCVRVVGEIEMPTVGWTVRDNEFAFCDRSGVAFQRAVRQGLIERSKFFNGTDNDIDGEITSKGDVTDIVIRHNVMRKGVGIPGASSSAYAVSLLAGSNADTIRNVQVLGNDMDRGIEFFDVKGAIVRDNAIVHDATGVEATIEARRSSRIEYVDNIVTRRGAVGPVLRMFYHNVGGIPSLITWRGGVLRQETDANIVIVEKCYRCGVAGAEMQYKGTPGGATGTPAARHAVRARGYDDGRLVGLRFTDLTVSGAVSDPVWVAPGDVAEVLTFRDINTVAP